MPKRKARQRAKPLGHAVERSPAETYAYWTPEELTKAVPRSLERTPLRSASDGDKEQEADDDGHGSC